MMIWKLYICILVIYLSTVANIVNGQDRPMIDIKVLQGGDGGECALIKERERALNEIHQEVYSSLENTYTCNGTPGWRRVAFVNMTDTNDTCPTGLNLTTNRTCGRAHTIDEGCSSTTFSVGGLSYNRVCGRIKGYQFGDTGAFYPSDRGIESYYVEGVSLTHGGADSRQHIWTFAVGRTENTVTSTSGRALCPCDTFRYNNIPSFVGNDYFCESGLHSPWNSTLHRFILFYTDPLWDGKDCTASSSCCQFNNPPWFTKNLLNATTDDIELRICTTYPPRIEDIRLELIELYVQ